jgi:hypothetical protein
MQNVVYTCSYHEGIKLDSVGIEMERMQSGIMCFKLSLGVSVVRSGLRAVVKDSLTTIPSFVKSALSSAAGAITLSVKSYVGHTLSQLFNSIMIA